MNDRPHAEAIYRCVADSPIATFEPSGLARGPWYPNTQHGGAVGALLARSLERHPSPSPMQVTRISVDLLQAAPMARVTVRVDPLRKGKNVEFLEAQLCADGALMARATALRMAVGQVELPENPEDLAPKPLRTVADPLPNFSWSDGQGNDALHHAIELRPVAEFEEPSAWIRVRLPLVSGDPPSALERIALAADFTYSLPLLRRMHHDSETLRQRGFMAINPETTIHLHRPLRGEWLFLESDVGYDERGAGTASARLSDRHGVLGRASQSLLVRSLENSPTAWISAREATI